MRTIKLRSKLSLLFIALATMIAIPAMALADDFRNDLDSSFDANFEVVSMGTGDAAKTVNIVLQTQGSDGDNGCNLDNSEKVELQAKSSSSAASVKWAATGTDKVDFLGCGTSSSRNLTVTPSSAGTANVTFALTGATAVNNQPGVYTVSTTGGGTYDLNTAQFTVNVAPPPNTAPTVSVTGVTHGGSYEKGSVPTAACSVNDAEDTGESANPVKDSSQLDSNGLGLETVTCSYTDKGGLTTTASATYSIVDTTAPVLSLPANITEEATGPSGAAVSYSASANDAVYGSLDASCSPASGSIFALGTTTVNCSATDGSNNTANGSFTVTVEDNTAPVLSLPANITEEATGPSGATVNYSASADDLVDGSLSANCSPTPGTFALGTTTVNCSAADAAGNEATGSFTVTVQDTTAPKLSLPANITEEATGPSGATVNYSASANDLVDGSLSANCSPAPGIFALGTTTVNCTATDAAGNKANGSFTVKVQDTTAPSNIAFTSGITDGASYNFGEVPAQPTCTATDTVGLKDCVVTGYSTAVGSHTLTATATDNAGNSATKTLSYTVKPYTLNGFYQPIDMNGIVNTVKSGATVPVKFELFRGTTELTSTSDVLSIQAKQISCTADSSATYDEIETLATGGTSLRYDATAGQFVYNWQTPKGAAGKCYSLTMTAADGSKLVAYFKLK